MLQIYSDFDHGVYTQNNTTDEPQLAEYAQKQTVKQPCLTLYSLNAIQCKRRSSRKTQAKLRYRPLK